MIKFNKKSKRYKLFIINYIMHLKSHKKKENFKFFIVLQKKIRKIQRKRSKKIILYIERECHIISILNLPFSPHLFEFFNLNLIYILFKN